MIDDRNFELWKRPLRYARVYRNITINLTIGKFAYAWGFIYAGNLYSNRGKWKFSRDPTSGELHEEAMLEAMKEIERIEKHENVRG